ncbi:phage tail protein, partial [Lactococcus lactis]|nr:phage tail protein [Lactococcus lactis]
MTIVASNSLTVSNVNDGTITHTAYANSADGTDGFTTVYPNLNLLDGTKDFSGSWENSSSWVNDGTYKGLTVKKRTGRYNGIYKTFTVPKDGVYTFSAYVKGSGTNSVIYRYGGVNITYGSQKDLQKLMGNAFDWTRDTITLTLKANDYVWFKYEISGAGTDSILWTAGHKYEPASVATPYMQSASEVTTADWPSYIGQYTDFTQTDSTNPSDYTWSLIRGNDGADGQDGKNGTNGKDGDPGKIVSDTEPTTRFKGLTWKYSGTTDLTASDGTVIKPNTEYYYNGTHWMINFVEANQIKVNDLSAISGTYTNGSIKNVTIDGSVTSTILIEKKHILFTFSDSSQN